MPDSYRTSDGKVFDSYAEASNHEAANSDAALEYFQKGAKRYHKGDYDGAIAAYTNGLRFYYYAALYDMRGEAYKAKGDYDQAIKDFTYAIDNPVDASFAVELTYYHRGEAYKDIGDYKSAIADYTAALRRYYKGDNSLKQVIIPLILSDLGVIYVEIGDECAESGDEKQAIEHYKKGMDFGSKDAAGRLAEKGFIYSPFPPEESVFREEAAENAGKKSAKPAAASAESGKKRGNSGLSLAAGIVFGIGIAFSVGGGYLLISGAQSMGAPLFLITLAACALVSALFIGLKVWKIVIPLALLAVAGYLILFGVIPESIFQRTPAAQTTSAKVISDGLNLRAEASGSAAVVKTLKNGDTVTVTGENVNGWTPVEHEGYTGWVSSEYLGE